MQLNLISQIYAKNSKLLKGSGYPYSIESYYRNCSSKFAEKSANDILDFISCKDPTARALISLATSCNSPQHHHHHHHYNDQPLPKQRQKSKHRTYGSIPTAKQKVLYENVDDAASRTYQNNRISFQTFSMKILHYNKFYSNIS